MINVKEYGIVSTDGDNVSVAAPTRDDYYPTMYEVKKEIAKSEPSVDLSNYYTKQEIDGKGYLTSIPNDVVRYTTDQNDKPCIIMPEDTKLTVYHQDGTFQSLIFFGEYEDGTKQTEVGAANTHLNLNTDSTVTVDTSNGKKTLAYTDQLPEEYLGMVVVNHGTADTTFTLTPNVFHTWDEVASLNLSFGEEIIGVVNEYNFQFISGSTATVLTLPDTVKWIGDNTVEANKTYQVSIVNNLAVMGGA